MHKKLQRKNEKGGSLTVYGLAFASDETQPWGPLERKLWRAGRSEKIAVLPCQHGYRRHRVHVARVYDGFVEMIGGCVAVRMPDSDSDFDSNLHGVIMRIVVKVRGPD
ncbi:MAG: hypothetical protein Q8R56_12250 [Polaromonas sp.]|nr:hypothetical protein [Polaromonas sp.]